MYAYGHEFVTMKECEDCIIDFFKNEGLEIDVDSDEFDNASITLMKLCEILNYVETNQITEDEFLRVLYNCDLIS